MKLILQKCIFVDRILHLNFQTTCQTVKFRKFSGFSLQILKRHVRAKFDFSFWDWTEWSRGGNAWHSCSNIFFATFEAKFSQKCRNSTLQMRKEEKYFKLIPRLLWNARFSTEKLNTKHNFCKENSN